MPIGKDGSDTRRHSDALLKHLIKPAIETRLGFHVRRGDAIGAQWITLELAEAIRTADLVVAVLSGLNPNVFFEMGVAQAWCRPMVALAEKDTDLPFDVKDLNTVFYPKWDIGTEPAPDFIEDAASVLEQLASVATQKVANSPFRRALSKIGSQYSLNAIYSGKRYILEVFEAGIQDVIGAMNSDYELVEEDNPEGLRRLAPDLARHAELFTQQSRALHKAVRVSELPVEIRKDCLTVCDLMAQTCQKAMLLANRFAKKPDLSDADVVSAKAELIEITEQIASALELIFQNKKELL